jgi:hypothetical protein
MVLMSKQSEPLFRKLKELIPEQSSNKSPNFSLTPKQPGLLFELCSGINSELAAEGSGYTSLPYDTTTSKKANAK